MKTAEERVRRTALPAAEELKKLLRYDSDTGKLYWLPRGANGPNSAKIKSWNTRYAGAEAGSASYDHVTKKARHVILHIKINDVKVAFYAHRIIWAMHGRPLPEDMVIDHKDRNPLNNRLSNLRLATLKQNVTNRSNPRNRKHALPRGVFFKKGRYTAFIGENGKRLYVGNHDTPEQAHEAYKAASLKIHGNFSFFASI